MLIFPGNLNKCRFVLIKCKWIAFEQICQKMLSFERKGKQYLSLNFDLFLSSFRVNMFKLHYITVKAYIMIMAKTLTVWP